VAASKEADDDYTGL